MKSRFLLPMLLLTGLGQAEIIDRVAASVGRSVVADSDIRLEIRLSSLMNGTEPDLRPESRRKTAERLVERALIETEMEIGRYPAPDPTGIESDLADLKKQRFPTEDAYKKGLAKYGLRDADVRKYLLQQRAVLTFIDARFGPAVQVMETEMREYYAGSFVRQWENRSGKPVPPFDEVRAAIEETLRAERVDRLLDEWLTEGKRRTRIEFREEAFR